MKVRVSKKVLFIVLPIVVVGLAGSGYFFYKHSQKPATIVKAPKNLTEEKVDDVFVYLENKPEYSKFAAMTTGALIKDKLAAGAQGIPLLIIFAPKDTAFSKEEVGDFNPSGADERILYHFALRYPAADGTKASAELADGDKISTIAGRELLVDKTAQKLALTDTKGREIIIGSPYVTDGAGNRIYPIDNLLLLQ